MAEKAYLDVEYHLTSPKRAVMRCPDQQEYAGHVAIDDALYPRLLELEHQKKFEDYGKALFEAAFPSGGDLLRGLYSVLDGSLKLGKRLRFRLNIDPGAPARLHTLHWELLTDGRDFEVGRSPETLFSRYVSQPYIVSPAPAKAKMLCVIAAPIDVQEYGMAPIEYEGARRNLDTCCSSLRGELEIDYLERPARPDKLRDRLKKGCYDLLHVHGHGVIPREREAALVLEDAEHRVKFTTESDLRSILLGLRDLKLVTLVACHGGESSQQDDHLSGLAGSLVKRNIPAVIAMRRAISMNIGFLFTKLFYRELAESPCVDAAINEARHRLYMVNSDSVDWSSPVLYMRLNDGLLWVPAQEEVLTRDAAETEPAEEPQLASDAGPGAVLKISYVRTLVVLFSVVLVVFLAFRVLDPSLSREDTPNPKTPTTTEGSSEEARNVTTQEGPESITESVPSVAPPVEEIVLEPIEGGKIGVAVIDSSSLQWNSEVTRIVVRHLRKKKPGLEIGLIPASLRSRVKEFLEEDFSALPGRGQAPGGFEYIFLVEQALSSLPKIGSFPVLRASCEMFLVSTREPGSYVSEEASHNGHGTTRDAALEQAFENCVVDSVRLLPWP